MPIVKDIKARARTDPPSSSLRRPLQRAHCSCATASSQSKAHGQGEAAEAIARAFMAAAAGLDEDRRAIYGDLMLSSLQAAARRWLEEKMRGYEFQSEFARTYVAKGELTGQLKAKAAAVITFLEARGLEVPDDVRERVLGSTDLAELDHWIRRAAVVSEARELFATTAS